MPPDECRSEGTPSLGEGPYVRGETFWFLLCRLTKGTRRKGETASRRYRSNGYAPPKKTRTKPISQDETSLQSLAPPPTPTNIKQKENISIPPLKLKDSTTDTVLIG